MCKLLIFLCITSKRTIEARQTIDLGILAEKDEMRSGDHRFGVVLRGKNGRDDWIRTSDLTHPKRARYQAAPRPDRQRVLEKIPPQPGGRGFNPAESCPYFGGFNP
jgi:hypothetical protein